MIEDYDLLIPEEVIMNKIYLIRGQKVMLDHDLAELYGVDTRRLNEQVKRNPGRFPEDFMFLLNRQEYDNLKSQFATSRWGGKKEVAIYFYRQLEQSRQQQEEQANRKRIGFRREE